MPGAGKTSTEELGASACGRIPTSRTCTARESAAHRQYCTADGRKRVPDHRGCPKDSGGRGLVHWPGGAAVTARRRDRPAPTAFPGDDRAGGSAGGGLSGAWARQRISPSRSRKLLLDCLDAYLDGTPRLRLAAGKALRERTVPVHEQAAQAIRDLVKVRETQPDQGIFDRDLGRTLRYLFLPNGVMSHPNYLFASPLAQICEHLAILNGDGKPALHAHRLRPTLGTQLSAKGARTQTIIKILGRH